MRRVYPSLINQLDCAVARPMGTDFHHGASECPGAVRHAALSHAY